MPALGLYGAEFVATVCEAALTEGILLNIIDRVEALQRCQAETLEVFKAIRDRAKSMIESAEPVASPIEAA